MAASRSGRSPRPPVVHVDCDALLHEWFFLAKLKDPGFEWDGTLYSKPSRALGSDQGSLMKHAAALKPLLQLAPSGFPSQSSLRLVFYRMEEEHQVFGANVVLNRVVEEACDLWRIMCRDIYNLKKNQSKIVAPGLQEIVNMITLPGSRQQAAAASSAPSCSPMGLAATAALFNMSVEEEEEQQQKEEEEELQCDMECEVMWIACKCPRCLPSPPEAAEDEESMEIPSAKR